MAQAEWLPGKDRVVVRRDSIEEKSPGGILLPDSVAENQRPFRGIVLSVGPMDSPAAPVLGQQVLYSRFGGVEISLSDYHPEKKQETLLVLHVDEILLRRKV